MCGVESQVALRRPDTLVTCTCQRTAVELGVVGCVERNGRVVVETLRSVPGHVLDREQSAVGVEEEIEITRADDGVVGVFDDALQNTVLSRALGSILSVAGCVALSEDVSAGALLPVGARNSVQRRGYVGAVEVDLRIRRLVVASVDYS
jgi:hypothetical protein